MWSLAANLERLREVSDALVDVDQELLLLRGIVENVPAAIVGADQNGTINFFNLMAQKMFGLTPADVKDRPITILMPERFRGLHHDGLRRAVETKSVEPRIIKSFGLHSDGTEFPAEIQLGVHMRDGLMFFTAAIRRIGPDTENH